MNNIRILQGAVYLQFYSKARLHKARAVKYKQILSLLYLGFVSLFFLFFFFFCYSQ